MKKRFIACPRFLLPGRRLSPRCLPPLTARFPARPRAGSLSTVAATTRATLAAIRASLQGGVRPQWQQGSSVTYAVAPFACSPAARKAITSACACPTGCVQPSPTTTPSRTSTQPTIGFGVAKLFCANRSARRIHRLSSFTTSPPIQRNVNTENTEAQGRKRIRGKY